MKFICLLLVFVIPSCGMAQGHLSKWTKGEITLENDSIFESDIVFSNQYFEGTVLVKSGKTHKTLSPIFIEKMVLPTDEGDLLFKSVETRFMKGPGSKKALLHAYYQGHPYSIYKKSLPDKNRVPYVAPYSYGYMEYIREEVALFIGTKELTRQVSKPSGSNYSKKYYKIEKSEFYLAFGSLKEDIRSYVKNNRLNINRIDHIKEIVEYANSKSDLVSVP